MKCDLESNGWRQGSLAKADDLRRLLAELADTIPEDSELVVISQSCDLAQSESVEPYVEAIIAPRVTQVEGNYTNNKNGRVLDLTIKILTDDRTISGDKHLRLRAVEKLTIPKERFAALRPADDKRMPMQTVQILADWLAARYSRSAFPTAFNDAIKTVDPADKKIRKIGKRISPHTAGLYFELTPNRDLRQGEKYRVNMLGLIIPSAEQHRAEVERDIKALKSLLEDAGMDVTGVVRNQAEVSVSVISRMQRMHLSDISHRQEDPLPPTDLR